jgi:hypothetical protein
MYSMTGFCPIDSDETMHLRTTDNHRAISGLSNFREDPLIQHTELFCNDKSVTFSSMCKFSGFVLLSFADMYITPGKQL